jgi:stage V sporulation protein S
MMTRPAVDQSLLIRVSSNSDIKAVAGAIAGTIRDHGVADVQAIGAGAVNQAVKSIAIVRSYLEDEGLDVRVQPCFVEISIDGEQRTAIRFEVYSYSV